MWASTIVNIHIDSIVRNNNKLFRHNIYIRVFCHQKWKQFIFFLLVEKAHLKIDRPKLICFQIGINYAEFNLVFPSFFSMNTKSYKKFLYSVL
jgi:hypothetical protein